MFGNGGSSSSSSSSGKAGLRSLQSMKQALDAQGIKYTTDEERDKPILRAKYNGNNFKGVTFTFVFDEDGESFGLRVYSIEKFTQDQLVDAMIFCNKMNNKKRWLSFYVDDDMEFTASMDAYINIGNCGALCLEVLQRAVRIVDDVCKELNS